eukprot:CAMPEP_0197027420 /NCGR_PEP_ID=MMETSP1384-20130603/7325_1 /TAXON_ID=29189 /ORGANISM="Ammonia sp." /LENGTH=477 /DNA_ID=CAMNT_0042456257 /DNA_START=47 /DNA_END=1480 /DNA_ORIENTATION=+
MAVKLEDSNMANYGSDEHKQMRTEAAGKEEAWQGVGQECGVLIWRIEKFKVVAWPKNQYGEFYDGDSYIILHTYKPDPSSAVLKHNVHFWLGSQTSQDEAGSAAYKTVELDDYLGQLPVQYRQVQGFESKEFLQLFDKITILSGGVDSGFNHVEPESYDPRLLKVVGKFKKVQVYQVKLKIDSLNSTDVFVLDAGLKLYQYNGDKCNVWEKRKGNEVIDTIQSERSIGSKDTFIIEGFNDDNDAFWDYFGGKPENAPPDVAPNDAVSAKEEKENANVEPSVNRVNDDSGNVQISKVASGSGKFDRALLDSSDAFIVDLGYSIYIWMGSKATKAEKREAMKYAIEYCGKSGRSTNIPIVRINEGNETEEFLSAFKNSYDDSKQNDDDGGDQGNVKRHWKLAMSFDAKNRCIVLRVTDTVTKQQFGKDIKKADVNGTDIVEAYKQIATDVNNQNVRYEYNNNPPLKVSIGDYVFSCPGM